MRKKILSYLVPLVYYSFLSASTASPSLCPLFSNVLTTHLYFGQDLNNLSTLSFQDYSLFQYIDDFGIQFTKKSSITERAAFVVAKARIKGIFGNKGSGLVPWQEQKKFQIWMREVSLLYTPCESKTNFFQIGLFPFKIGNGLVLGNAYNINIPISWQYLYEQIDQFRPGLLIHLGNQKKSVTGDAYLAMTISQNNLAPATSSTFERHLLDLSDNQSQGKSVIAVFQMHVSPLENHIFQISPSLFFQKDDQCVEFPHDAQSTLFTPSISGSYQFDSIRLGFECAKNVGHQEVKALDRALITSASTPLLHFENASDRYRKPYSNSYAGFLAYVDFLFTKKNVTWGMAALYASGDNDPQDSYETLILTRFTPGVSYKDHNKKYKGFIGPDQLYEAPALNNLYFGAGNFSYSNLAFVGSTLQYVVTQNNNVLTTQGTWVSYFKPHAHFFDITNQNGLTTITPASHYLGTEINWSVSYSLHNDFIFSLLGGIFFPGKFYKELKQEFITLEQDLLHLVDPTTTPASPAPTSVQLNKCYFASAAVIWQFDSSDIRDFFTSQD